MRSIIETNLASNPAWWLVDDNHSVYQVHAKAGACWQWTDGRPEGVQLAVSGDWFPSEKAASEAARRARRRACVAVGP